MKKIIREVVIPVVIAIILGFICGKYVFRTYRDNLYQELESTRLYLAVNGEYDTLDSMQYDNLDNYVYYVEHAKYMKVVGITHEYDNIDKIKKIYGDNLAVYEYYLSNDKISGWQEKYDNILKKTDDIDEVKKTVNDIINLYKEGDTIKLVNG